LGGNQNLIMKAFLVCVAVFSLFSFSACGQAEVIVRERAKSLANQNNTSQGVPTPARTPTPQAPMPQPNPALNATLQNIASLQADLAGLEGDPAKKQSLINNLSAAPQGSRPSKTSVSRLADDLATALAGKKVIPEHQKKLAQYLRAMLNSSHLSPAQQRTILADVPKILQSGGVPAEDAMKIANDLKAIALETK
jgi:hypothetical protein